MSNFSKIQVINGQDIVINKKAMSTEQAVKQLNDNTIANYQEQVDLLKSINETNDMIIEQQNKYISELEDYIKYIKNQSETLQEIVKR